jgi:hypothetical protein
MISAGQAGSRVIARQPNSAFVRLGVKWSSDRQNRCRNIGASEIKDEIAGQTPYFGD